MFIWKSKVFQVLLVGKRRITKMETPNKKSSKLGKKKSKGKSKTFLHREDNYTKLTRHFHIFINIHKNT